ncbi:hypothetical protein PFDSM3638_02600 [Pyrococcus furiosus DSM 3638]|uniref:GDT1 family protein n=3 Tax=Pyrococcus furiosus TaxID=2261 RepID=A0A5C0XMW7_PYRFU|nr:MULTISPECIES: TMEM165/GDT1 family protein [Pyrococcus]AAL80645.1 hypothetical protein PF0521 [Pyrococcus furiosus DSM 3638]AFN03316.1 hypothetical protein PFC_01725 [Pyrococcus furiosus COM1]MDK2870152.1 hypothetical protein [Pyrococcus sp.]QEK78233.1 hypothetical protein PFDSM3638_02600 [Pyrococcus furiosus DSM 3638]
MKEILSIFIAIFLAEFGDKTQLATIAFASKYGWFKAFVGAATALVLVNLIGALVGEKLREFVPASVLHKIAGVFFIIFGILMIIKE